ncbi:MAG: tRNA (adenosine(37)-N6)-threonylcarbamoyltransferase complex transferase subunit TsaD [bacterium]|nr:tRNA (adenosine(37)-N6)-threonylcarbamoyltransferase complex transferase subunit TsaD [bacterium]
MRILGIETSCDETGIAIIEANRENKKREFKILSDLVFSQVKIHKKWGGVVPGLAKREHQKILIPLLKQSLENPGLLIKEKTVANKKQMAMIKKILSRDEILLKKIFPFLFFYKKPAIDYIAVTQGPGLEPALWTGINLAKVLSFFWKIPIIPINHIESHIFINFLKTDLKKLKMPAISLVVSGGHTQLILMNKIFNYKIIGDARDDAAGECFDKTGRLLGIDYPAGPIISKLSQKGNSDFFAFPRPMINSPSLDFSFSGLKTAVLYFLKDKKPVFIKKHKKDICAAIQKAIVDVLVSKTLKAAKKYQAKTIILGGGVASNDLLRKEMKKSFAKNFKDARLITTKPKLNTDNGLMVAITAFFRLKYKKDGKNNFKKINAIADLKI